MELYYKYRIKPIFSRFFKVNKKQYVTEIKINIPLVGYKKKINEFMDVRFTNNQKIVEDYFKDPTSQTIKHYIKKIIAYNINDADVRCEIIMEKNKKSYSKWKLLIQSLRWYKNKMDIEDC